MKDYPINIFYSDEDKEVQVAKEAWLEAARELGKPIPVPAYRQARRTARNNPPKSSSKKPHRARS